MMLESLLKSLMAVLYWKSYALLFDPIYNVVAFKSHFALPKRQKITNFHLIPAHTKNKRKSFRHTIA